MDRANSVVCICETHEQVERALYNLEVAGIDTKTISLATQDGTSDLHDVDDYSYGDQTFVIPGLGLLLVNGPLASWIASAFQNGTGGEGVSIVGVALATLGIPRDSVLQYEAALKTKAHVIVLHSLPDAVAAVVKVIGGTTHCHHTVHGENVYDTVHRAPLLGSPAYTYQA